MAITGMTGPLVVMGNTSPVQNTNFEQGPSLFADGTGVVDDRFMGLIGSASFRAYGLNSADYIPMVDAFPQTLAANNVVAATGAGAIAGTALTLATGTVQSAVSNVPIVPWALSTDIYGNRLLTAPSFAAANVVTAALALDFGMCAGTTFTSSTVTLTAAQGIGFGTVGTQYAGLVVNKNQIVQLATTNHSQPELMFTPGQWIIVANAGNAGGTVPLLTQVLAVDFINHYLYVSSPALAAVSNAGVANANAVGSVGIAAWPWQQDGASLLFDPRQGLSRALKTVSTNAGDTTVTLAISGWDSYGIPMNETLTLNGTTPVLGKKAFKYIKSVTTGVASLVGNVTVGTQDVVGLNLRADAFSYLSVFVADTGITANTGFVKADVAVATATTGDVRGTYALQSAADGTKRVFVAVNPSLYNWQYGTNLAPQSTFGMPQF